MAAEVVEVTTEQTPQRLHDDTVREASRRLWNNDFAGATALVEPGRTRLPRHALMHAECFWLRSLLLGQRSETDATLALFADVRKLVAGFLEKHPQRAVAEGLLRAQHTQEEAAAVRTELEIVQADANLLSGMVLFKADERLKAAWRIKKAWNIYSALHHLPKGRLCEELRPSVQFGTGIFLFLLSWMPPAIATILSVIGFESNRRLGLELLKSAAESDSLRSPNGTLITLVNLIIIPRALADVGALLAEAKPFVERALERWPNGSMFLWMASYYDRKQGNSAAALEKIDRAIASMTAMIGHEAPSMVEMDRAVCLVLAQRWAEAGEMCPRFYNNPQSEFRCLCVVVHAMCVQMQGDRNQAIEILRTKMPADAKGKDKMWQQLGLRCMKRKSGLAIFPWELLYLRRDLAHMHAEELRPLIAKLESDFSHARDAAPPEEMAVYHLVHGSMLRFAGDVDAGVRELQEAAAAAVAGSGFKDEKHVAAFVHCELAEAAHARGDVAETERLLKVAQGHNSGVLDELIRPRIRIALDQLRTEKKAASNGV